MSESPGRSPTQRSRTIPRPVGQMHLTDRDIVVLSDIFLQRTLTRSQLMALGHFGSCSVANTRLRVLFDHRFVRRSFVPTGAFATEAVYTLGSAAVDPVARHLEIDRHEVRRIVRAESPTFLAHSLAVAHARIAFSHTPFGVSAEWLAECQVRHEFTIRSSHSVKRHTLKPDGAVLLTTPKGKHCLFIELDRGHVNQKQFGGSCATYRRYFDLLLAEECYGVASAQVLCITTVGESRMNNLADVARGAELPMLLATAKSIDVRGPYDSFWLEAISRNSYPLLKEESQ